MEEDRNIVTIGDLRLQRLQRFSAERTCPHKHLLLDPVGSLVECADCGKDVGAFWALCDLAERYQRELETLRAERRQVAWERQKHVRRTAARDIEAVWNRKMVPCCPHCGAGITPEDGLGHGMSISKELDARNRADRSAPQQEG